MAMVMMAMVMMMMVGTLFFPPDGKSPSQRKVCGRSQLQRKIQNREEIYKTHDNSTTDQYKHLQESDWKGAREGHCHPSPPPLAVAWARQGRRRRRGRTLKSMFSQPASQPE